MSIDFNHLELTQRKNPLVIYHANCADGFAAAWCFHNIQDTWEVTFDFHPGVYNEPPPDVEGRIVYLVDFSYPHAVVVKMLETAKAIYLIDHHKTALDALLEKGGIVITQPNFIPYTDLNRSGAMLAWDFLHNTTWEGEPSAIGIDLVGENKPEDDDYIAPPPLLLHIQDRDLWRFALPKTREINAALFSCEYDFAVWDSLMSKDAKSLEIMAMAGEAIDRSNLKNLKEILNVCRRYVDILDYHVPLANIPYFLASDAGNIMSKEYEGGTLFSATYYDTADHRIFSLRSDIRGVDVADVAKQYGGGGHSRAAGFRVSRDHDLAHV